MASLGHAKKIQRVLRLGFVTVPTSHNGDQQKFARCSAVSLAGILIFLGLLPPNGIQPSAKFTLRPSLAFSYFGSVTARHSSCGREPNCDVVQGMELRNFRSWSFSTEGVACIRRAVITLGIGPHSSLFIKQFHTRMWANAQRDGRAAKYRWCPLRNFPNYIPCTAPQSLAAVAAAVPCSGAANIG